jgi:beta-lactamase class A
VSRGFRQPAPGLTRRSLLAASVAALAAPGLVACGRPGPPTAAPVAPPADPSRELADLEARFGGRIGVCGLDTGSGAAVTHRADERFPLCSTFKALAAAAILRLRLTQPGLLDRLVRYDRSRLLPNSPVTERHVADGMTVAALCEAAIRYSDNAAANELLRILGGPGAVTAFVRTLGDPVTRLDRWEIELNVVPPGEERDTTTPARMAADLRALVLGDALDPPGRELLTGWLVGNTTGNDKIRAGVPAGWRVGDKTGGGPRGEVNDVAVAWPPGRAPLVLAVYTVPADPRATPNAAVLASVAAVVARAFVPPPG